MQVLGYTRGSFWPYGSTCQSILVERLRLTRTWSFASISRAYLENNTGNIEVTLGHVPRSHWVTSQGQWVTSRGLIGPHPEVTLGKVPRLHWVTSQGHTGSRPKVTLDHIPRSHWVTSQGHTGSHKITFRGQTESHSEVTSDHMPWSHIKILCHTRLQSGHISSSKQISTHGHCHILSQSHMISHWLTFLSSYWSRLPITLITYSTVRQNQTPLRSVSSRIKPNIIMIYKNISN